MSGALHGELGRRKRVFESPILQPDRHGSNHRGLIGRGFSPVDAGGIGVGDRQRSSGLARLETDASIALGHGLLHHSLRNAVPHRVRRLAHSLKRDICPVAVNR